MQAGDDASGKQVRCPKCQTISIVPAPQPAPVVQPLPEVIPDPEPQATAVSEKPPETPRKRESPPASGRRYHDVENDKDDKKTSKPQVRPRQRKAPSMIGPLLAMGGFVILMLGCLGAVGFGGWYVYAHNAEQRGMADGDQDHPFGPPARDGIGKQQPGGGFPDNPAFNGDPNQPRPPQPPDKITLNNGKFETQVGFVNPLNVAPTKCFEFEAKADTVYWAKCDDFNCTIQITRPDGQRAFEPKDPKWDAAFLAGRAGVYTITVEGNFLDRKQCKLTLREMDGSEQLPQAVRLTSEAPDLPALTTTFETRQTITSAAFSPNSKMLWIAHHASTLVYWDHAGMLRKGSYTLGEKNKPEALSVIGVDREGRLYGQLAKVAPGENLFDKHSVADIHVWEKLAPNKDDMPMPAPTKVLPLKGIVRRFINSPDGRWLYYLDVENRKLGRIDPDKVAVDKEIEQLSPGTRSFCVTGDGKRIYCCSESNRIDVINAATFKLEASVMLDRGQPTDIAATNSGLVYLVGGKVGDEGRSDNIMMVDLTRELPGQAKVIALAQWIYCEHVQVLPDQRAVLFGGDRRLFVYSIPKRPALFNPVFRESMVTDYFTPGEIVVSPDSRTVVYDRGTLLSISR
jgi:hypothetical protein